MYKNGNNFNRKKDCRSYDPEQETRVVQFDGNWEEARSKTLFLFLIVICDVMTKDVDTGLTAYVQLCT